MKIDSLTLKNYRQYKDERIRFDSENKDKNFIVIQGTNGSGKTNILNAITWCLYGKELHLEKSKGLPIYNTILMDELKPENLVNTEVELRLIDDDSGIIIITRKLNLRKSQNGEIKIVPCSFSKSEDGSEIIMQREENRDIVTIEGPEYFINMMIPEKLEEYFFFDGERLDKYFTKTSSENIHEAVFRISQLELFEKLISHLDDRKRDLRKKVCSLSSKAEGVREELEIYETSIKAAREEKDRCIRDLSDAEAKEKEYSDKLRTNPNARKLEEEWLELTSDLDIIEKRIKKNQNDKFNYLLELTPPLFCYDAIIKAKKKIEEREEAGQIPPDYKKEFLERLLEQGNCICGEDISQDANEKKYRMEIESLLKKCDDITDITKELITENVTMRSLLGDLGDFKKKHSEYINEFKELEEERKIKSERLLIVEEEKKGLDIEQINTWENKLTEYRKIKDNLIKEIAKKENRIEDAEKKAKSLEKTLNEELKKKGKGEEAQKGIAFCDECLKAAENIKQSIMDDLRSEIEEQTRKHFLDLIWKKETYKDIKIDGDYNIFVIHQSGFEGLGTLSAGERQVLALSFMAALNSVSGFNVPIVIDTPLARLGREPKKNIAKNLPNYLEGKQVTLLVTEEEYTSEVRDNLSDHVGKEYRILFEQKEKGSEAKVIPYER
jgi:DNA sulfur modification protein DndD